MNVSPLATLVVTALLAATPYSQPVNAGTGLQRCQTQDGTVLYTDKACGALGATTTPISGQLTTRIAREEAMSDASAAIAIDGQDDMATIPATGRRSLSGGCARTPTQLAMDLRGAFALGDVNRIAESYHWTGLSHQEGQRIMARLEQFTGKRISDVDYFNAQIQSAGRGGHDVASTAHTYGGSAGVMQVRFGTGASTSVADFDVEKYSDCYFIKF
ncbi:MAG: hypothetical protein WKF61_12545 [Luteimonas sp.]